MWGGKAVQARNEKYEVEMLSDDYQRLYIAVFGLIFRFVGRRLGLEVECCLVEGGIKMGQIQE